MIGYLQLALAAVVYAVGIIAQTTAARRAEMRAGVDPGLLVRLATDRLFLVGFFAQVVGFALTYLARATLPLYLVQAGTAAAVGLAAFAGVTLLGWTMRGVEVVVLAVMACGLVLIVDAARPSTAYTLSPHLLTGLGATLALTMLLAVPACRLGQARGAVALGALAGVAFAVLAIACRSVADQSLLTQLLTPPIWIVLAAALVGQTLMTAGFQRGSATATAASMDATSTVLGGVVGLAVLGDRVADGRIWVVALGLFLVVGGVLVMAAVATGAAPARAGRPPASRWTWTTCGPTSRPTATRSGRRGRASCPPRPPGSWSCSGSTR